MFHKDVFIHITIKTLGRNSSKQVHTYGPFKNEKEAEKALNSKGWLQSWNANYLKDTWWTGTITYAGSKRECEARIWCIKKLEPRNLLPISEGEG